MARGVAAVPQTHFSAHLIGMPPSPEPEILQPRFARGGDLFSDRNLDLLSHLLDDFLRIPGTQIRFGLDGIIGLIPGIGDIIGAMASWIIILAAWLRGVPRITLARMLANVAIETIIGTIPILGDAFDIAWKANRRNYALLERSIGTVPNYGAGDAAFAGSNNPANRASGAANGEKPAPKGDVFARQTALEATKTPLFASTGARGTTAQQRKRHAMSDWLFLVSLLLGMMVLLAIPLLLLAYLMGKFFSLGAHH
jgi:hypothetical protein